MGWRSFFVGFIRRPGSGHFPLKLRKGTCNFPVHGLKSRWKHKCGRPWGAGTPHSPARVIRALNTAIVKIVPQAHYIYFPAV